MSRTATSAPAPAPTASGGSRRRLRALLRAEMLQFRRNTAVAANALIFPVAMSVGTYLLFRRRDEAIAAATAIEIFLMMALLFVIFYAALSMATNRRDEGVLKRLRSGESRDVEVLIALCAPGALVGLVLAVVVLACLLALGAPAAVHLLPVVAALVLGGVLSSALALLTSTRTRNAEAAQITSLPVISLAMISLGSVRQIMPERVAELLERTPFALISDLAQIGWSGRTAVMAAQGLPALGAGQVLAESWSPIGLLAVWTLVIVALVPRYMRWDDRA